MQVIRRFLVLDTLVAAVATLLLCVECARPRMQSPAAGTSGVPQRPAGQQPFSPSTSRNHQGQIDEDDGEYGRLAFPDLHEDGVGETVVCLCPPQQFACHFTCTCIPAAWRCDHDVDCEKGEDEEACDSQDVNTSHPSHPSNRWIGPREDANYPGSSSMGNHQKSLPMNTEIRPNCRGLRCPSSGTCISREWLCDGDDDCGDFWDEASCGFNMNCTVGEFGCDNGLCVQQEWVCDGDNDCKDNSDESNCTASSACREHEFQCADGSCISDAWRCDAEPDCSDGSDEVECDVEAPSCREDEFQCAYPRCVRLEFRCDGNDDCGDWSDEDNCPSTYYGSCRAGEFKCNSGKCIPERWLCDAEPDCDAGEDELKCEEKKPRTCSPGEFSCSRGNCILSSWVCDGVEDCPLGEDEQTCVPLCDETQFACVNGSNACISRKHVCDGKPDCAKGEDEKNCPTKKECAPNSKCEQSCVTFADGKDGCACGLGFKLAPNGYSCRDIDECTISSGPVCSQTCHNTAGSFTCSCNSGYILRSNGRSCKALGPPAMLLFANRVDIRQVSLNNVKYTAILKGLHNAIALDYHYELGMVYWSDVSVDMIRRAYINGTEPEDVIRWGLESPGGVALDWVHNLLFWTDSGTRRVEVASLDGSLRSVLAASDLDKPRAIAVHPGEALVFWTDWGPNPKIESCEMDGSNRRSIVTESVFWPNGLTIDYAVSLIYWADAKHHVIECARFDGSARKKIITKGLPHPFALTVFEDSIYWTDWHTKSISTASKISGSGFRTIHSGLHFPMDIHSYHPQRQPEFNSHCLGNNGGCSHLCLPNRRSYICVCPMGLRLKNDKRTCDSAPEKLLLFARSRDLRVHLLGAQSPQIDMVVPVDGVQSAVALGWDSESDTIFWTDVEANTISRAALNGSSQRVIVNSNLESPAGLAVDWVTCKIYWTDAGTSRIEVANMDGTMRALLIWEGLDKPRDIVVDPIGGYMYWSDWGEMARIERAGMDGSVRKELITQNLTWPNGLAIDHEKGRLYWADGGTKAIEYAFLDGTGRTILIGEDLPHPFGLAVFEDYIYWSDWDTTSIHTANKMTGRNRTVLRSGISGLMDVRVFHRDRQPVPSLCHTRNGGCSHLCLLAPLPVGHTCACPIGIKLLDDGRTCANGPTNSLIFAHRVDIRQISLDVAYVVDVVLPLPPLKNAVAVDVDRKTGEIYWTDTAEDVIQKAKPDGSGVENIIIDGLESADGIVIDSTGRKLYWTDGGRSSIEVAELDGRNRKVLIWSGLDSPRAITLHYHLGLMFWSNWGKVPSIEQADMDGHNRITVVSENLGWPNGLAIDRPAGRLYWNDGKLKTIESSELDGTGRHVVVTEVPHPYGLVVVGSHLYWTDWQTEALHRADKESGAERIIIRDRLEGLMDIRSVQADNVAENACGTNNGGCSHLCLRQPQGFSCACPTGTLLGADGRTCSNSPQAYLLFATRSTLARVSLDTPELWDVTLPIPDVHNAIAVDFHWATQTIFYTDVHLDVIKSVDMHNLSNTHVIVKTNLTSPNGLAVDWIANNVYWTDTSRKVLEVARLDGSSRKMLIHDSLDEPRALALFPRKGFLYWTDWGDSPKIERSLLDGSMRRVIVGSDLGFPNGLALDFTARRLYWADALRDRIETSDLNGRGRTQLVPEATHPFGLTQFGTHIYWTDWYKKSVERADKLSGKDRITLRTDLDGVMEIRAVSASRQMGWTPCAEKNGGCSHLCLYRPPPESYICACPDVPDHRPCSTQPKFLVPLKPETDDMEEITGMDPMPDMESPREGEGGMSVPVVAAVLTLASLAAILGVGIVMALVVHRRRRQKKHMYAGRSVLTFSNPNYNASNSDVLAADKRPFLWKKLKYDKAQVSQATQLTQQQQQQTTALDPTAKQVPVITSGDQELVPTNMKKSVKLENIKSIKTPIKSPLQEVPLHPVLSSSRRQHEQDTDDFDDDDDDDDLNDSEGNQQGDIYTEINVVMSKPI